MPQKALVSTSFKSERRQPGKEFRDGVLGEALDDLYGDIDDGFAAIEASAAAVTAAFTKEAAATPAQLVLKEATDNGTNKATVKPPATLGADVVVTLPTADVDLSNLAAGTASLGILGTVARFVAEGNVIGGIPVVHILNVVAAAGDNDIVLTHKTRFMYFVAIKTDEAGTAGGTLIMKNGANAITDAMVWDNTVADKTVKLPATIDDAQWEVAAGGALRGTTNQPTSRGKVLCIGVRVA
jgi:hypothetical protein